MYIALLIMFCGFVIGKIFQNLFSPIYIQRLIMASIFLLLFLLGISVGSNSTLLAQLPALGMDALLLALFGIFGSILAQRVLMHIPVFKKFLSRMKNER